MDQKFKLYPTNLLPWQVLTIFFISGFFLTRYLLPTSIVIATALLIVKLNKTKVSLFKSLLFILVGITWFQIWTIKSIKTDLKPTGDNRKVIFSGKVDRVLLRPNHTLKVIIKNLKYKAYNQEGFKKINLKAVWTWKNFTFIPIPGQTIKGTGLIRPIKVYLNPGTINFREYWLSKGVGYTIFTHPKNIIVKGPSNFLWHTKIRIRDRIITSFPDSQGKALLLALLLGDRSLLSYKTIELMRKASLSHCLAISGMHLGFMVSFAWLISWVLGYIFPSIFLYIPRPKLTILLSIPLVLFYILLNPYIPSLTRAGIMFFFISLLVLFNRANFLIDGIFIALLCFAILSPNAFFDLGLQLSFIATLSIVISLPYIHKLLSPINRIVFKIPILTLAISIIATLGILPLILFYFGRVSPNLYLNIVWIPILGWVSIPFGFLGLIFSSLHFLEYIGNFLLDISIASLNLLLSSLELLNNKELLKSFVVPRPLWYEIIGYWILLVGIFLSFTRKKNLIFVLIGILFLITPSVYYMIQHKSYLNIKVFDVGDGESYLINTQDHKILINGGGAKSRDFDFGKNIISPILSYHCLPTIDKIILTYPKFNRLRGLYYILSNYKVKEFLFSGNIPKNKWDRDNLLRSLNNCPRIKHITSSYSFKLNNIFLDIYRPRGLYKNASTFPLWVKIRKKSRNLVIFISKIPSFLYKLDEKLKPEILIVYIRRYKNIKDLAKLCEKLKPKVLIINCGSLNLYRKIQKHLKSKEVVILSPVNYGCITISLGLDAITIKGFHKGFYSIPYHPHKLNWLR